jgi:hypothetical protein
MTKNTAQQQLYDMLVSKDFNPVKKNSRGASIIDPDDADMIKFDYKSKTGKDYGTIVVLFTKDNEMTVFFGDNVGKTMEPVDKDEWFNFVSQLRFFAKRHRMVFNLENIGRLKYVVRDLAHVKESLNESFQGNSRLSWSAPDKGARLVIEHSRKLSEHDARYRHISKIFIETTDGERFKLPFKNLSGAKAMLEHVRQGGRPYDMRGNHIVEMVSEVNILSRFRRAHHNKVFEGETKHLIEQSNEYFESLKRDLKRLSYTKGYSSYFENWQPMDISDGNIMVEDLKGMFVEQTLDHRIELALPLLAKLQQGNNMKEITEFEVWSQKITEGTWAIPNNQKSKEDLAKILSEPLAVGPDAANATEVLYDIFGDDELFDKLDALAMEDPDADARELILQRMQELGIEIPNTANIDLEKTQTGAQTPPPQPEPPPVAQPSGQPVAPQAQSPATPPVVETDDYTDPKEIGAKINPTYVSPAAKATKPTADQLAAKATPQPLKISAKTTPVPDVKFESELDKIKRLALGN